MLHYIIQTIAFQLFFLIIYDAFLKKETFFNWNRVYLLVTAALSLIIPFIKINKFKHIISQDYIIKLPEVFIGNVKQIQVNPIEHQPVLLENKSFWSWEFVFYLGIGLATLIFTFKLIKLLLLLYNNPKRKLRKVFIVSLLKSDMAFSFFNYIFLGDTIKPEEREAVLKHEMVHVKQKHTLDLLFFELLRILFWFNPLVYMCQKRMMSLHEYIADAQVVKHQSKTKYYQSLLAQVFETKNISFINPFFKQSLIKNRIIMLQKSKSKQVHLFKYALLIPMVFGMLVYTSCEKENKINQEEVLDLSQYSYTLDLKEKSIGEEKTIHENYKSFLKANPEYVGWVKVDKENEIYNYTIHKASEKTPEDSFKNVTSGSDGSTYVIYMYLGESSKAQEENEILKSEKITKLREEYMNESVSFSVIEQVPVFPGCENMTTNKEQRHCMSKKISKHVNENFNNKFPDALHITGRQRINVLFKINKEGEVVDIRVRSPHLALKEEAIRVIKTLPKMIPGKQKGKAVNVPYSLPIIFQVK